MYRVYGVDTKYTLYYYCYTVHNIDLFIFAFIVCTEYQVHTLNEDQATQPVSYPYFRAFFELSSH